jgi:hypothetical protein
MPINGTLDVSAALTAALSVDSLQPDPWDLPGVRLVHVSMEIDEDAALAATPPSMHPSVPPYATFTVLDVPESPVGPFGLAQVRIIARAGIRPRGFLIGAVCNSADAIAGLDAGWGFGAQQGDVTLSTRHDRWAGTVVRDGVTILEAVCRDPQVINGGDVDLIASLHLVRYEGEGAIEQVDPEYVYHDTNRGAAELPTFDPAAWGSGPLRSSVRPTSPNVAVAALVDTDMPTPRFVMDPVEPAISGTKRLTAA